MPASRPRNGTDLKTEKHSLLQRSEQLLPSPPSKAAPLSSAEIADRAANGFAGLFGIQENRLRRIIQIIQADPACSIQDLADRCHLSHSHLQHLFKQHTGMQLGHLLAEHRLQKAAELLEESALSVKEIATLVGYEHTSSFIRAFERRFTITPRSYRQQSDSRKS